MARFFILPDGMYFETLTDVNAGSFADGRVAVDQRPSVNHVRDGGVWVEVLPEPVELLGQRRATALAYIDQTVGRLRLNYITDIPGQQMIYQTKEMEARAFQADSDAPKDMSLYPYIDGEAGALGVSPEQVVSTYLTLSAQWRATGAQLEALRVGAKAAIMAAADLAAVSAAVDAFDQAISQ